MLETVRQTRKTHAVDSKGNGKHMLYTVRQTRKTHAVHGKANKENTCCRQ